MTGTIVLALVLHFIADFLLQSRDMGKNKSSQFPVLLQHIGIQFGVMALGLMLVLSPLTAIAVSALNAAIHGVIDWHIWRGYKAFAFFRLRKQAAVAATGEPDWNIPYEERFSKNFASLSKNFQYWEDHWFYATIGFDQLLHAVTIILALKVLV